MQKFLSGLIAAFMLAAGLVAISGEVGQAAPGVATRACTPTQYTPCLSTTTTITGAKTVKKGKKPVSTVTVRAAGNVKPKGTLTIAYKGPGLKKTIKTSYTGAPKKVTGPAVKKKGTYTVSVSFTPSNQFKPSKGSYKFKVK